MRALDDTFWGIKPTSAIYRSGLLKVWDYRCCESNLHGQRHWAQVHQLGLELSEKMQFESYHQACVEVFAWTHDLARRGDGSGNLHATEGADYFQKIASRVFPELDRVQRNTIELAIRYHSDGCRADEFLANHPDRIVGLSDGDLLAILGCSWDADRLDLIRLGIGPDEKKMSTPVWRSVLPLAEELNHAAGP